MGNPGLPLERVRRVVDHLAAGLNPRQAARAADLRSGTAWAGTWVISMPAGALPPVWRWRCTHWTARCGSGARTATRRPDRQPHAEALAKTAAAHASPVVLCR